MEDTKIPKSLRKYIKKARETKKKENKISQRQVSKQNQIVIINQDSKPKRQSRKPKQPKQSKKDDYPRMVYAPSFPQQPQPPAPIVQQPQLAPPAQPAPQVPPQFQPIQIPRAPFMNEPLRSSLNPPPFSNLEPDPRNIERNLPFIPIPRQNPFTPSVGSASLETDPFRSISPLTMNSESYYSGISSVTEPSYFTGGSIPISDITSPSYFTGGSEMGSAPYDGRSEVRSQRTATTFGDLLSSPPFSDLEPSPINQEQNLPFIPVPRQNPILEEIVQEPNRRDFLSQPSSGSLSSRSINPSSLSSQGFVSNESVNQLNTEVDEELNAIMNFGSDNSVVSQRSNRNYSAMPTVFYDTADDTTIRSFGSGNVVPLDVRSITAPQNFVSSITGGGGGGFVENKAVNDLDLQVRNQEKAYEDFGSEKETRLRQLLLKEDAYGKRKKEDDQESIASSVSKKTRTSIPTPKLPFTTPRGRPPTSLSKEDIDLLSAYGELGQLRKNNRTPEQETLYQQGYARKKALRENKEAMMIVKYFRDMATRQKQAKKEEAKKDKKK